MAAKNPANKVKTIITSTRVMLSVIGMALIVGFFCTSNQNVFALTDAQRYNTGYNWGCSDGKLGGLFYHTTYLVGDVFRIIPSKSYTF
jgi:hypothetical protein